MPLARDSGRLQPNQHRPSPSPTTAYQLARAPAGTSAGARRIRRQAGPVDQGPADAQLRRVPATQLGDPVEQLQHRRRRSAPESQTSPAFPLRARELYSYGGWSQRHRRPNNATLASPPSGKREGARSNGPDRSQRRQQPATGRGSAPPGGQYAAVRPARRYPRRCVRSGSPVRSRKSRSMF